MKNALKNLFLLENCLILCKIRYEHYSGDRYI